RARINFSPNNRPGTVELSGLSLREAPAEGLPKAETLEEANVALRASGGTASVARDYWSFLVETERETTRTMRRFLKETLGVQALVYDTQAGYGQVAGLFREGSLSDLVDDHGYWEHPSFPGGDWDPGNWTIRNVSQVGAKTGGTLADLAMRRVAGKPFTVSEYNIPSPNDHAAEALPMLAAFAAFQDWDALYAYTYVDFSREWAADHLLRYFDFCGHAGKLVFAPLAARAFRSGLVAPGRTPVTLTLPGEAASYLAAGKGNVWDLWETGGMPPSASAMRRMQVKLAPGAGGVPSASERVSPSGASASDTNELFWDPDSSQPLFAVSAPAFRMLAGAVSARKVPLGDVTLEFGKLGFDYACFALVALDDRPVAESQRLLVALASRVENQGMTWNADRSSVGRGWGKGPTIAEIVPATLTLPGTGWKAESLDGFGAPAATLPVESSGGATRIRLNDSHPSLWYSLSR
ncbi:MAG: hypothetical protein AAB368_16650, partial [bacterium]